MHLNWMSMLSTLYIIDKLEYEPPGWFYEFFALIMFESSATYGSF